nr:hypothetical protein BaRGS_026430 [Batillaria attramentaria]
MLRDMDVRDEKKRIFNAHCKNEVLLQSIKSQCDCGEKDVVELSDERGVVKNLRHFPSDYGSEFLKERETVVLLSVKDVGNKEETEGERPVFTPLLTSLASNQDFIDTLNPDGGEDAMADGSKRQLVDIVENEDDNNKSTPLPGWSDFLGKLNIL